MERIIILLVAAIVAAISNWQKKRREAEQRDSDQTGSTGAPPAPFSRPNQPPAPPRPAQRPMSGGWEEEMRRLLGDERPVIPPAATRPAAPPPLGMPPFGRPAAPPPVRRVVTTTSAPVSVPAPPPVVRRVVVGTPEPMPSPLPVPKVTTIATRDLASLDQARVAYARASQLDKQVSDHIAGIPSQRVGLTSVTRAGSSAEAAEVAGWFRNARTVRQAVIASVILNPPKALEEGGAGF